MPHTFMVVSVGATASARTAHGRVIVSKWADGLRQPLRDSQEVREVLSRMHVEQERLQDESDVLGFV